MRIGYGRLPRHYGGYVLIQDRQAIVVIDRPGLNRATREDIRRDLQAVVDSTIEAWESIYGDCQDTAKEDTEKERIGGT